MPSFPSFPSLPSGLPALLGIVGVAVVAALVGGLIPVFFGTSSRLRGYLLHFAAGVLLAVVSVEIWPEIYQLDRGWAMVGGLVAGATMMTALNLATRRLERRNEGSPAGLVACVCVDSIVDGLLIGIGYAASPGLGILLAIGFSIEKFTTSMTVAAEVRQDGCSRGRTLAYVAVIAALLVPAAMAGMILLAAPTSRAHTFLLAVAAAALIYIVIGELIVRGQRAHDTSGAIAVFFAGFIALASYAVFSGV